MKRLVFALGLIAAATGCGLQAQNLVGYAKIPFDFRMGQSRMPAGDYELKYSGQALVLHERSRNGKTVLTLPNHATRPTSLQQPTLQFLHFGDTYVLSQVWPADSYWGLELLTRARRALISRTTKAEPSAVVVAGN